MTFRGQKTQAAAGSSSNVGTLTSSITGNAFGTGPSFTNATLTLTQTGGTEGHALLVPTGDTTKFAVVEINGEALDTPIPLASAGDLLVVAWGDGATSPTSTTVKLGVARAAGLGTHSASLAVVDENGTTIDTHALSATVNDSFRLMVEALGGTVLYSPSGLATGALADTNPSLEDLLGVEADAICTDGKGATEIAEPGLFTSVSLTKALRYTWGAWSPTIANPIAGLSDISDGTIYVVLGGTLVTTTHADTIALMWVRAGGTYFNRKSGNVFGSSLFGGDVTLGNATNFVTHAYTRQQNQKGRVYAAKDGAAMTDGGLSTNRDQTVFNDDAKVYYQAISSSPTGKVADLFTVVPFPRILTEAELNLLNAAVA